MKTITQIALEKKTEYDEEYLDYCRKTQRIMHGASSKSLGADIASYCDTGDDLKTLIKIYERKGKAKSARNEVHGHFFVVEALEEILAEYNAQF